jgi:hypothetical protein
VRLVDLTIRRPVAYALLESDLRREPHSLGYRRELLVTGTLYPALSEVSNVRAVHNATCGLLKLAASPSAAVRMAVGLKQMLELLGYVHFSRLRSYAAAI